MKQFFGLPNLMSIHLTSTRYEFHLNILTSDITKAGQLSGNPLGKNPGDVWIFPNVKSNHVEKTIHPCQFPIELVERLVLSLTDEGDQIIDPYMGVGTSVVAAVKNNRIGFGCDTEKAYVDVAWERIHDLRSGTLKFRPRNKPVYDPSLPNGGH
jgi:adenine-specific DNA-methyltransferase